MRVLHFRQLYFLLVLCSEKICIFSVPFPFVIYVGGYIGFIYFMFNHFSNIIILTSWFSFSTLPKRAQIMPLLWQSQGVFSTYKTMESDSTPTPNQPHAEFLLINLLIQLNLFQHFEQTKPLRNTEEIHRELELDSLTNPN